MPVPTYEDVEAVEDALAGDKAERLAQLLQLAYRYIETYPEYAPLLAGLPSLTANWDDLSDYDKNFRRHVAQYLRESGLLAELA